MNPVDAIKKEEQAKILFNAFDLTLSPMQVFIPFADLIMPEARDTTSREIFDQILKHIQISALIYQHQRKRYNDGIVAQLEDYINAYELVINGTFNVLDPLSSRARKAFEEVLDSFASNANSNSENSRRFTQKDLQELLVAPASTVSDWIHAWQSRELIDCPNFPQKPYRYRILVNEIRSYSLGLISPSDLQITLNATQSTS
jgi:hypothetical protein